MGILTCIDSRPRLAFPGTPPELVSPSSSTYSSRPSESALPSPPLMSGYGQPTAELLRGKSPEDSRPSPREQQPQQPPLQQQQQERLQLPPLSSILTLTQERRPLRSPVSEGRRAYSATTSPLDRPHTSSASSSSYFPPTTAPPRLRAGPSEARLDDRPPLLQPLSRDPFQRAPLSPQPREREPVQQQYRPSSAAGRSSYYGPPLALSHPPRHREEYSPLSCRTQLERYPGPLTGIKREADQMSGHHRDGSQQHHHQQPQHHHHQYPLAQQLQRTPSAHHHHAPAPPPPPPASAVVSEGVPSKDGLGPKIWTGTHFLPRFVRAAEVPGEGTCYFYDDGSHCKAVIDGEQVNAHWGVTKAGKPRKRLAIACITCREKKIKCDPDYPRCVQCEKFGRVCKFKNAPRGGNTTSPSTPPAEMEESRRLGGMVMPPPVVDGPRPGSNSSASVSPRTVLRPASPEMMNPAPTKRPRLGFGFGDHGYGHPPPHQAPAAPSYSHYTHAPQRPPSPYSHHHDYAPQQQQQQHHPHHYHHYHHQQQETRRSPVMLPLPLPVPQLQRDPRDGGKADWQHQRHDLPRIHDDLRRGWQPDSYVHDPQPCLQHQHQHPSYQHHYADIPRSPASRELPPLSAYDAREGLQGLGRAPVVSSGGGSGDGPAQRQHRHSH